MGLVSDGGVHSHIRHLEALLQLAVKRWRDEDRRPRLHRWPRHTADIRPGIPLPASADLDSLGHGRIASVSGRYYAMDRDHRWDRTKLAFDAIVHGIGPTASFRRRGDRRRLRQGVTDEFIVPTVDSRAGRQADVQSPPAIR